MRAAFALALILGTASEAVTSDTKQVTQFVHPGVFIDDARLTALRHEVNIVRSGPVYDAFIKALDSQFTNHTVVGPPASKVIECGPYSQ
mgnify:CR=1 FL=1